MTSPMGFWFDAPTSIPFSWIDWSLLQVRSRCEDAQGSAKNPSLASPSEERARDRSGWARVLMLGIRAMKKTREACL